VEHHIVDDLGRGLDLPHDAFEAPVGHAQRGEVRRHAGADAVHVRLGHFRPHRHGAEIGDAHDLRRGLGGVHGLALDGAARNHRALHGRIDAGVAEIGAVFLDGGARRTDLRLGGANAGLQHGDVRLLLVDGFLADRVAAEQAAIALETQLREPKFGLLARLLRLEIVEVGLVLAQPGLIDGGIDLGDQLALLDLVADVDMHAAQLAGDLRADVDIFLGLQRAQRRDGVLHRAPLDPDLRALPARLVIAGAAQEMPGDRGQRDDEQRDGDPADSPGGRTGHAWTPAGRATALTADAARRFNVAPDFRMLRTVDAPLSVPAYTPDREFSSGNPSWLRDPDFGMAAERC